MCIFLERLSWLVFFLVNLVTQGALNYILFGQPKIMPNYMIFGLVFVEIFVFITEMIVMPIAIKEKKQRRTFTYAFTANIASLILGGYLIQWLPV